MQNLILITYFKKSYQRKITYCICSQISLFQAKETSKMFSNKFDRAFFAVQPKTFFCLKSHLTYQLDLQ